MGVRFFFIVLLLGGGACTSAAAPDGNVGEADASVSDAGADAGPGRLPDAGVSLSSAADALAVRLAWDAADTAEAWLVFRDGIEVARLGSTARAFEDLSAAAGTLSGFDASVSVDLPAGVEIEWSTPSSEPGTPHTYFVRTETGPSSNTITGARTAPVLLGFSIERDDAGWSFDAGETLWLDVTAPSPSIFVASLTATATPNDQTTSVVLRAAADAGRILVPVQYRVIARATGGQGAELLLAGSRGGQRVEYQWQRSTTDSPTGFIDLPFVHGLTWFDPDAVLSEGRYYRVAARLPGQEWLSAPVRAELRAPLRMVGNGNGRNSFILRDDGVSLSLQYPRPPVQFPPLVDFFPFRNFACGLLSDAGIECDDGNGSLVSLPNMPPAQSARGTDVSLWLGLLDGGVDGYYGVGGQLQLSRHADLLDAWKVVGASDSTVCGSRADGGVRCSFFDGSFAELPSTRTGFWVGQFGWVAVSDAQGRTTRYSHLNPVPGGLPVEDAGYVDGSDHWSECGVRTDGLVRCVRSQMRHIEPPVSAERYVSMTTEQGGRCGLTTDRRVRCYAQQPPHVPPAPPVRDVQVQGDAMVALLENGLVDVRGAMGVTLRESADDRFVALSRDWRGLGHPQGTQCGLRADGVALCGGGSVSVPNGSRYRQITSEAGLLLDGGVESFVPGGPSWPGALVLALQEHGEAAITCAHFADGGWACSPEAVFPSEPLASISLASSTQGCGLTDRGQLRCWPDPPPSAMARRRFGHVHRTPSHLCATALDGEVLCANAAGDVLPALRWDDFVNFEQSTNQGCGIRRDRTVACRADPIFGRPPWAP